MTTSAINARMPIYSIGTTQIDANSSKLDPQLLQTIQTTALLALDAKTKTQAKYLKIFKNGRVEALDAKQQSIKNLSNLQQKYLTPLFQPVNSFIENHPQTKSLNPEEKENLTADANVTFPTDPVNSQPEPTFQSPTTTPKSLEPYKAHVGHSSSSTKPQPKENTPQCKKDIMMQLNSIYSCTNTLQDQLFEKESVIENAADAEQLITTLKTLYSVQIPLEEQKLTKALEDRDNLDAALDSSFYYRPVSSPELEKKNKEIQEIQTTLKNLRSLSISAPAILLYRIQIDDLHKKIVQAEEEHLYLNQTLSNPTPESKFDITLFKPKSMLGKTTVDDLEDLTTYFQHLLNTLEHLRAQNSTLSSLIISKASLEDDVPTLQKESTRLARNNENLTLLLESHSLKLINAQKELFRHSITFTNKLLTNAEKELTQLTTDREFYTSPTIAFATQLGSTGDDYADELPAKIKAKNKEIQLLKNNLTRLESLYKTDPTILQLKLRIEELETTVLIKLKETTDTYANLQIKSNAQPFKRLPLLEKTKASDESTLREYQKYLEEKIRDIEAQDAALTAVINAHSSVNDLD